MPRGLYLLYRLHNGIFVQSKVYLASITLYPFENYFHPMKNIIPEFDNNAYALEYNPVTGEIKMIDDQTDEVADYIVIELNDIGIKF